MPPLAFWSATIIKMVSLSVVSLIAMVPDSEWRIPTLIGGSCAAAGPIASIMPAPAAKPARAARRVNFDLSTEFPSLFAVEFHSPLRASVRGWTGRLARLGPLGPHVLRLWRADRFQAWR